MYQIEFATRCENRGYLDFVYFRLLQNFNKKSAIIHRVDDDKFSYILFAGVKDYFFYYDDIIKNILCELLQKTIKYEYMYSNIDIKDKFLKLASASLLQNFDTYNDLKIIKNQNLYEKFFIDSYFEFRKKAFLPHWEKVLNLSFQGMNLIDTLKTMLSLQDNTETVFIFLGEEKSKLYIYQNTAKLFLFAKNDEVFCEILRLNPKFLKIFSICDNLNIINNIKKILDCKIEIISCLKFL